MLIEKSEPQIEAGLVSALQAMKKQHPEESKIFLTNWVKLDTAIRRELGSSAGRRKRTLKSRTIKK
jgi:hypothetical protein